MNGLGGDDCVNAPMKFRRMYRPSEAESGRKLRLR